MFDSANPLDETSTSLLNTAIVLSCGAILFFLLASLLRWFRPARPSGGRSASLARLMGNYYCSFFFLNISFID